ncbi:MAG: cation:proton antiporter [Putridiphycobacter sp.]
MKSLFVKTILISFLLGCFGGTQNAYANVNSNPEHVELSETESAVEDHGDISHDSGHAEEHHTDVSPLLFVVFALLVGAISRHFLSKVGLPFTVVLLLIGLLIGVLGRNAVFENWIIFGQSFDMTIIDRSINWAAHLDPHLILYVFLPILIFEAAFAMDVHVFKKTFVNATMLAVPGILLAIFMTAGVLWGLTHFGLGLEDWTWQLVLLFGAVISATDPVAVVAILKELGASKKLGTLIEGESMLNDGTAIVIFMVIFMGITGSELGYSPILEFFRVSFGGVFIGFVIGKIALFWIGKVFKDVLVEATIIIVSAYFVFFICENVFAVSGVLGLVTLGVLMAGPGRTKISAQVQHFIHEFWEFTAFAANTLIFLIVGVVIAERTVFGFEDVLILLVVYAVIHVVRMGVIALLFPVLKRNGYGLNRTDATVLWWGALRGAIGLALALIVESSPAIELEVREQFLFLIAGTVTLTLLINATTMKALANYLGLTKVSLEKKLLLEQAEEYVETSSNKAVNRLKQNRFYKKVDWDEVNQYVSFDINKQVDPKIKKSSQEKELRRRILEKEKASYWKQFEVGALGGSAYRMLMNEVNEILDSNGEALLSDRHDLDELLSTKRKMKASKFTRLFVKSNFKKLSTSFDVAIGFYNAQLASEEFIKSAERSADPQAMKLLDDIEFEIEENKIQALTYLRNFKKEYPEIYKDISTKKAILTVLNQEKKTINRLYRNGRLTGDEKDNLTKMVDDKINKLF